MRSPSGWGPCAPTTRVSTRVRSSSRGANLGGWRSGAARFPGSPLELRSGPLVDELQALGADGVQSLLLEGGPTLAAAFFEAGLVDKLMVFFAPLLVGGEGPQLLARLRSEQALSELDVRLVGEDALVEAYVQTP